MRQKHFFKILLSMMLIGIAVGCPFANGQDVNLPAPQKELKGGELMQALQNRHSVRSYSNEKLSDQVLSNVLWAANGVNRADGRRTSPSAINAQDIEIYVGMADGVYHYMPADNKLAKVSDGNLAKLIMGRNKFILDAPVVLLLVSNQTKFSRFPGTSLGAMDAGYVSQNICLYCSAFGLATVPCAPKMDVENVQKMLGLSSDYIPEIYHPVGYSK
jgi:SagB-type dehydrogenase family enzyme